MNLSVIIICCNAAGTIERTLKSIKTIADEIIILDSGSTDNTVALCKQYTQDVHQTDWPGYGIQKQRALDLATKEWVLSIDADEVVTPELALTISAKIKNPGVYRGFKLAHYLIFDNHLLKHCADPKLILVHRRSAKFTPAIVHETLLVTGPIGKINQPFLHYSYKNMEHWVNKMNAYTNLSATKKQNNNKKSSLTKAIFAAAFILFKKYILKKGFLDGKYGFIYCLNASISTYIKYIKLSMQQR